MGSVNKVILLGNLVGNPEIREVGASSVASFSIATNEVWKDKDGNRNEAVEYHDISAWGNLATICGNYLKKGDQVYVEGKLKTDTWESEGVKRRHTKIKAVTITMLNNNSHSNKPQSE